MAEKELIIRIKGDGSPLKAAAAAAAAELRKVDQEAARSNAQRERDNKRLLDQILKDQQKAHEQAVKEAKRTADAQAKEAKRAADAQAKEEAAKVREAERAATAQERAAKRAADAQAREAKRAFEASFVSFQAVTSSAIEFTAKQEELARKRREKEELEIRKTELAEQSRIKRSLTGEEVALLAKNKLTQESNQKRIDAAVRAAKGEKEGFDLSRFAGEKFSDLLSSVAGQFTLLSVGSQVLSAIKAEWDGINRSSGLSGKFLSDYRKDLLELAALKGQFGNTTTEAREQLVFRAATLQSADNARRFQEAAIGSGAAAIGRQISQAEFDKLMLQAGQFQAAEGGDPVAHGQLAGMLPLLMKQKNVTASQAMQQGQQLYDVLQFGGSNYSEGVRQLVQNASLTTSGLYKNIAEQAVVQSAFSLTNPKGAGENVQQFTRATVGALGRMRGQGVMVDERQAEYLKRIGATDQMSPTEIGKLISADFAKQELEAGKQGQRANLQLYLQSKGYMNMEDMQSLMSFHGFMQSGQFTSIEDRSRTLPGTDATARKVAQYQAADPDAQRRKAEIAGELAKASRGAGPNEYYNAMRERAFAQLVSEGKARSGEFEDWKNDTAWGGKVKIDEQIKKMLRVEAARAKVPLTSEDLGNLAFRPFELDESKAKKLYDIATRIGAAGGPVMPSLDPLVETMQANMKATEKVEKAIRDAVPSGVPPALPAAPPPAMRRP